MLDDASLADKLAVAREWFRRSRTGEFQFTGRHADKFAELLEQCEHDATVLEAANPADQLTDNVVRLFEQAPVAGGAK